MLDRVQEAIWGDFDDFSPVEKHLRHLASFTVLVASLVFAVEALSQGTRSNLPFAGIAGLTAVALVALVGVARLGSLRWVGHGLAVILSLHALFKLAVTGGDSRAFAILAMAPLLVVPLCGLRAGISWMILLCIGSGGIGIATLLGHPFPLRLDAGQVASDTFGVAIVFGLASLSIAAFHEASLRAAMRELQRNRVVADHAEAELLENNERNRALLEYAFDGVIVLNEDLGVSYLSPSSEGRLLGYSRRDLGGGPLMELAGRILHPEDRALAFEAVRQCLATPGKLVRATVRLRKHDGSYVMVEANAHNLTEDPAVGGIVINYRDVSPAEVVPTSHGPGLPQPDLANFAAGLAHRLRNLLTIILGRVAVMESPGYDGSFQSAHLREIQLAADDGADLAGDVLLYSGETLPSFSMVDLRTLLSDLEVPATPGVASPPRIELQLPDGLPPLRADAEMVERAVTELVKNSFEADSGSSEPIVVRARECVGEADFLESSVDFSDGQLMGRRCVALTVEDRATGIAADDQHRIFDPFFTTQFLGRGLGLPAVLGAMRAHNGAIRVDTTPTRGTTITLLFGA
jgi:PAS domain S-box-containing protein